MRCSALAGAFLLSLVLVSSAHAGELRLAVASNFADPMRELARVFTEDTGIRVGFAVASSGQLAAQIQQSAPFDVFLSADQARVQALIDAGLALADTRFSYAFGRLALYGSARVDDLAVLADVSIQHIAIANPQTAPYGRAAMEVFAALQIDPGERLVRGNNVAQAFQFVDTGHAELGLVALSLVRYKPPEQWLLVPDSLHEPIAQDAVLLSHAEGKATARAFLDWLRTEPARNLIRSAGYSLTPP